MGSRDSHLEHANKDRQSNHLAKTTLQSQTGLQGKNPKIIHFLPEDDDKVKIRKLLQNIQTFKKMEEAQVSGKIDARIARKV